MHIVRPHAYSYPALPGSRVTIVGAGDVTKSLLLAASLLRPAISFRVIARSARSAELVRQFLNDLPRLDVEVIDSPMVPDLSNELVVLAAGERTARFSAIRAKERLYTENRALAESLLPQVVSSVVIVVTNPSTAITKYFIENGVQAYGVGVANDQLRFNNQAGETLHDHYFVGGHNFTDLVLGSRHSTQRTKFTFSRADYRDILDRQDRKKRLSLRNLPHSLLDFDWPSLEKTNAAFPPEYRWYARQRIHSKFHNTSMSCSLAILNTICFFTKRPPLYTNFSLEMPLYLPGSDRDVVLGWPIDGTSMQPLELAFDQPEQDKLATISRKYAVDQPKEHLPKFYFTSPFGDRVSIVGRPGVVHEFFQSRLAHLFSFSTTSGQNGKTLADIVLVDERKVVDDVASGHRDSDWSIIPQHRGKNPQEHTDLRVLQTKSARIVRFPGDDAIGMFEDEAKRVTMYCGERTVLFHELRRLVRDEIGVPCLVSRGARVLHAGLITFKGLNILVLGASGGGKTTAVLSLLSFDATGSYGAAERTLAWVVAGRLLALGIPESVTVFPGTLKDLPEFEAMVRQTRADALWNPRSKARLQLHDILSRLGCAAIQREVSVDIVVEVAYDPTIGGAHAEPVRDVDARKNVFARNDLTEDDPVRIPWLGWFPRSYSRQLYECIAQSPAVEMHTVKWAATDALRSTLIDIVARKKLYDDAYTQARVHV